ncbi:MAG: hypothetical protein HUJ76_07790 [Parasporobacterium sp.]|nr:hypothetical protein [Parasporobacterium sp.]
MASLKCSKCGEGIHFHSIPQDIEYTYIPKSTWIDICNSRFNKSAIVMDSSGMHPKLFRSDTIENDFEGNIYKMWKCPNCGTMHLFDKNGHVNEVFEEASTTEKNALLDEGLVFSDYYWDNLTEKAVPDELLKSERPTYYCRKGKDVLFFSEHEDFSVCNKAYVKLIPDWMETQ